MEKSESKEIKYNYTLDRQRWVKRKNGTKVKLRKYVAEIARMVSKHTGVKYNLERKYIIKAYNVGGFIGIITWATKQLKNNENKN